MPLFKGSQHTIQISIAYFSNAPQLHSVLVTFHHWTADPALDAAASLDVTVTPSVTPLPRVQVGKKINNNINQLGCAYTECESDIASRLILRIF